MKTPKHKRYCSIGIFVSGFAPATIDRVHKSKDDDAKRIREASRYLNSTVSQTLSWGAHAFIKGWAATSRSYNLPPDDAILPSLIQYGVKTPEAVVVSILGVPRSFGEATAQVS